MLTIQADHTGDRPSEADSAAAQDEFASATLMNASDEVAEAETAATIVPVEATP